MWPRTVASPLSEAGHHRDDIALHAAQAREHAQPEAVLGHEERVGLTGDPLDLVVGVPDEGGMPAAAPVEIVPLEVGHRPGQLLPGSASLGKSRRHSRPAHGRDS